VAAIGDIAGAARDTAGRYFSLVSGLPAAVLVVYVFVLAASGAWSHTPRFGQAFHELTSLSLGGLVALAVASVGAALVLHPLQVAMVQVLEGYWGSGAIAVSIRGAATAWYMRRMAREQARLNDAVASMNDATSIETLFDDHRVAYYKVLTKRAEATRLLAEMPDNKELMPTRLGNVLRFYERTAGSPYGLDAI